MDFSEGALVDVAGLASNVIHQKILTQRVGSSEVGFPTAKLRDFLHEMHQAIVARKHEGIDQYSGALALRNFLERLRHHKRIKAKSILVNAPIFESQCRRLAIRDHHN